MAAEQQREFMAVESDLDLANRLQLEEAMAASLAFQPSSSQSHSTPLISSVHGVNLQTLELDKCVICLDDKFVYQFLSIEGCTHRFCYSCINQHVEVKLLNGVLPKCPHEGCVNELRIESCEKFLTPKFTEMMRQRLKEDSIPVTEKVYCPYPKCSTLMSKTEAVRLINEIGAVTCYKCHGDFCINCRVPWHKDINCADPTQPQLAEESKLKNLAARNLWRQCIKCKHMIELVAGCYHMTCRCGYEFCYTCGEEWKNKMATCTCPLWDEENIVDAEEEANEIDNFVHHGVLGGGVVLEHDVVLGGGVVHEHDVVLGGDAVFEHDAVHEDDGFEHDVLEGDVAHEDDDFEYDVLEGDVVHEDDDFEHHVLEGDVLEHADFEDDVLEHADFEDDGVFKHDDFEHDFLGDDVAFEDDLALEGDVFGDDVALEEDNLGEDVALEDDVYGEDVLEDDVYGEDVLEDDVFGDDVAQEDDVLGEDDVLEDEYDNFEHNDVLEDGYADFGYDDVPEDVYADYGCDDFENDVIEGDYDEFW